MNKAVLLGGVLALCGFVGCGGGRSSTEDVAPKLRPPYGGINLVMETAGVQTVRQLFLDPGSTQFPKKYPILVGNHQDNATVQLWRYDFIEAPAPADPSQALYGTMLVRVDDGSAGYVSFFGRAGSWPVGAHTLNPATAFVADAPETPQNKKDTCVFLFLRQGAACRIVDPQALGRVGGYRTLSDSTTVAVAVPALDFPVGGATLTTSGTSPVSVAVGTPSSITPIPLGPDGKPQDGISTPIQTVEAERVATTDRVSPATSEFDLVFAWQPPSLGVTVTHGFYADPSLVGGVFGTGQVAATGGGFFLTQLPGAPSVVEGVNTLNWTYLRTSPDAMWTLGWSADVAATGGVTLGQSQDTFSQLASGQALVTAQVRGFLSGLMAPGARATMFMGRQDKNYNGGAAALLEGTKLPLIARTPRAVMAGQLSQLVVGGRSLWYRQNQTIIGADVVNGDQTLVTKYGTTLSFATYLPVRTGSN